MQQIANGRATRHKSRRRERRRYVDKRLEIIGEAGKKGAADGIALRIKLCNEALRDAFKRASPSARELLDAFVLLS